MQEYSKPTHTRPTQITITILATKPTTQNGALGRKKFQARSVVREISSIIVESIAPTVIADVAEARETDIALMLSIPVATTRGMPCLTIELTALLRAADYEPPRDMERMEHFCVPFAVAIVESYGR